MAFKEWEESKCSPRDLLSRAGLGLDTIRFFSLAMKKDSFFRSTIFSFSFYFSFPFSASPPKKSASIGFRFSSYKFHSSSVPHSLPTYATFGNLNKKLLWHIQ
jgi:hypothetical protein